MPETHINLNLRCKLFCVVFDSFLSPSKAGRGIQRAELGSHVWAGERAAANGGTVRARVWRRIRQWGRREQRRGRSVKQLDMMFVFLKFCNYCFFLPLHHFLHPIILICRFTAAGWRWSDNWWLLRWSVLPSLRQIFQIGQSVSNAFQIPVRCRSVIVLLETSSCFPQPPSVFKIQIPKSKFFFSSQNEEPWKV